MPIKRHKKSFEWTKSTKFKLKINQKKVNLFQYNTLKETFAKEIDIEEFITSVTETTPKNKKNGFSAIIHADKDVPNLIIENIIERLKKNILVDSIYRTCVNDEIQQVSLIKLYK